MKKSAFNFRFEWKDALSGCPAEVRLEVYEAIIEYAASGTLIDLKPVAKMAFSFIQKTMDEDRIKSEELRRKRSEGGKKGMRNRYNSLNENLTQPNSLNENLTQPNKEIPPKERSPIPPKEYTPKDLDVNNNILLTRTREEIDLQRFDALLQEVVDGRHQIWENAVCKKFGIEGIKSYLHSFRKHAIVNARLHEVADINGFKQYFVNSFKYFTKENPIELLGLYEMNATDDNYKKFCRWLMEKCCNVARSLVPISEMDFLKLKEAFGAKRLFDAITQINEREDVVKKYYSLYRLIIKWLEYEK